MVIQNIMLPSFKGNGIRTKCAVLRCVFWVERFHFIRLPPLLVFLSQQILHCRPLSSSVAVSLFDLSMKVLMDNIDGKNT